MKNNLNLVCKRSDGLKLEVHNPKMNTWKTRCLNEDFNIAPQTNFEQKVYLAYSDI